MAQQPTENRKPGTVRTTTSDMKCLLNRSPRTVCFDDFEAILCVRNLRERKIFEGIRPDICNFETSIFRFFIQKPTTIHDSYPRRAHCSKMCFPEENVFSCGKMHFPVKMFFCRTVQFPAENALKNHER